MLCSSIVTIPYNPSGSKLHNTMSKKGSKAKADSGETKSFKIGDLVLGRIKGMYYALLCPCYMLMNPARDRIPSLARKGECYSLPFRGSPTRLRVSHAVSVISLLLLSRYCVSMETDHMFVLGL